MSTFREGSYCPHVGMILYPTYEPKEALFELGQTIQRKTNDPSLPPLSPLCLLYFSLKYSRTKRLSESNSKREITEVIHQSRPCDFSFLSLSFFTHSLFKQTAYCVLGAIAQGQKKRKTWITGALSRNQWAPTGL